MNKSVKSLYDLHQKLFDEIKTKYDTEILIMVTPDFSVHTENATDIGAIIPSHTKCKTNLMEIYIKNELVKTSWANSKTQNRFSLLSEVNPIEIETILKAILEKPNDGILNFDIAFCSIVNGKKVENVLTKVLFDKPSKAYVYEWVENEVVMVKQSKTAKELIDDKRIFNRRYYGRIEKSRSNIIGRIFRKNS